MNRYFTRQASYGARGFYIREDNYLTKLPLFAAKSYPMKDWYDKEVLMTSSDGGEEYIKDREFLKRCLIYTCLSSGNNCISFNGSDGHYYRNELCLDGDTLANKTLSSMELLDVEKDLIDKNNKILCEIKRKNDDGSYKYSEYNSKYSYGIHQISLEIDISIPKKDENGNIIYKKSNNKSEIKPETVKKYGQNLSNLINHLQRALDKYYIDFIAPKMFEYELIK